MVKETAACRDDRPRCFVEPGSSARSEIRRHRAFFEPSDQDRYDMMRTYYAMIAERGKATRLEK
jgi:hypothetical protein